MVDFFIISEREVTKGKRTFTEIYPKFIIKKSEDLMIRGGDFYAIWLEDRGMWSTDEQDAIRLIDSELKKYATSNIERLGSTNIKVSYLWDAESGMIDRWHKYCQKQCRDNYVMLDEKIIFGNTEVTKEDYASKRLGYPLKAGDIKGYDKLMGTLYEPEERHKLEWAIGSIVSGDSKYIQKFIVLYGAAGTGKSTFLNIVQRLFDGYYSVFDAKSLGSANSEFALEAFNKNPLVAIQHDGDLSRIEDNTRLNSLVSHETMRVNEKFKSTYENRFKAFLFMGSNKPVKITDAKSGILRRLIDVRPSGNKLSQKEYDKCTALIPFELGGIAQHCLDVYLEDPNYYDSYVPMLMMGVTNTFYNFVLDSYLTFSKEDSTTLKAAWEMYKLYVEDAKVQHPLSQMFFKEELKNYFRAFEERGYMADGQRARNLYTGFRADIFIDNEERRAKAESDETEPPTFMIDFKVQPSIFDEVCADCPAQLATEDEKPTMAWDKVKTKLKKIDTSQVHYVRVPENHIVIDFDIPDEEGNKCLEKNILAASKWPPTYAELSKSGAGIHLHYIYTGDVSKLSRIFAEHVEVKVFTGKSSLRRRLSKCNDLPIATISSGLPVKGEKMVNFDSVRSEKGLRTLILRNLAKEIHPGTKPSVDFIKKILDDAYDSGLHYDVSDMRPAIFSFAAGSTHQSEYCLSLVSEMKFHSEDISEGDQYKEDADLVMYDVEVFPNLFVNCWASYKAIKAILAEHGDDWNACWDILKQHVNAQINPKPIDVEGLLNFRLVDFNGRNYDRHILYGRLMGYSNEGLYDLSQKIITSPKGTRANGKFGEAYNLGYLDIWDCAANKQSLKKWEIQLGIHHQELGLPWDRPVPEELWEKVADYCKNDVLATIAVYDATEPDRIAREILSDLAAGTMNDTTNSLTTRIIFGNERHPQDRFMYRNLAEPVKDIPNDMRVYLTERFPNMMASKRQPDSILPYFPGYEFDGMHSTYRGEETGEGGYVYAEPSIDINAALLDIASMHPHSDLAEYLFGIFTRHFDDLVYARVAIKHEDWDAVANMLDGKLIPYIQKVKAGEIRSKDLAYALKIAINSVYGLTAAGFENPFKDPRNKDNIVAKRGALFMIDLKHAVQDQGYKVLHVKTDSIKIPNADQKIIDFVMAFGQDYGYTFEHEATYDRICLVNDAVYIAKYADGAHEFELSTGEKINTSWTATGTQFQVPYVFKTCFSHTPLRFEDYCETKSVSKGDIYLDMNEGLPDVAALEKELDKVNQKFKKGELSDTTWEAEKARLEPEIAKGHNYIFVGRVGQFTPVKEGHGGGVLYRYADGKYYALPGTKGYRWLESEVVKTLRSQDDIDDRYYRDLVDAAIETINQYGDYEMFVSDSPYICDPDWMKIPPDAGDEIPFEDV